MSSLADLAEIIGFFSYSREDDEDSKGALSRLRERIQRELRGQLGRSKADLRLWQDQAAIAYGTLWENEIRAAIAESVFFIPIVTPRAVRSQHCKLEFESFLAREAELGRSDLVFPILYIRVPALEDEKLWRGDPVLKIIGSRHYLDWRRLRHADADSSEVGFAIEDFCTNIFNALHRPWAPSQRRRNPEQAPGNRRSEDEARTQAPRRRFAGAPARTRGRSGSGRRARVGGTDIERTQASRTAGGPLAARSPH